MERIGSYRAGAHDVRGGHEALPENRSSRIGERVTNEPEPTTFAGREQCFHLARTQGRIDEGCGRTDSGGRDDARH